MITPIAAARAIQMPTPRPAKKKSSGTIFVLIRVISVPDDFFFAGRGVGIWIALAAAIGVILAGLLQASEVL